MTDPAKLAAQLRAAEAALDAAVTRLDEHVEVVAQLRRTVHLARRKVEALRGALAKTKEEVKR